MDDILNILKEEDGLDAALLLKYSEGTLTAEEQLILEQKIQESDFIKDAVEGVAAFNDTQKVQSFIDELNRQLKRQTTKKKKQKSRRKLPSMDWIIFAVIVILLLSCLGYAVLKMHSNSEKETKTIRHLP